MKKIKNDTPKKHFCKKNQVDPGVILEGYIKVLNLESGNLQSELKKGKTKFFF